MTNSLFNQPRPALPIGLPDGGDLGAMSIEAHINSEPINLVYRALDEVFDHRGSQLARELVNFANQHNCNYALLVGGSCWVAESRGLSFAAQLENHKVLKNYDMVVMPFDDVIYLAAMDNGLLLQEKVYPVTKALEILLACKNDQQLAILAGGKASNKLQQAGLNINCSASLVTGGKKARAYTYQPLSILLLQHRLYHTRLLLLASKAMVALLSLGLLFYYFNLEEAKEVIVEKVKQAQEVTISQPQENLNNHANQVLLQLKPWLGSPWLDFLTTCRLTEITLKGTRLAYQGQWMDKLQGCGNSRLRQVVKVKQLQLNDQGDEWRISGIALPISATPKARPSTVQTLDQLQQLALYLGWQLTIQNTLRRGEAREIRISLAGKSFNQAMLKLLSEHFLYLPAQLEQVKLVFNPDNLDIISAEFEFQLFTTGEERV